MAVDTDLAQKPADLDALLQLLRGAGIEASPRGKSIRLKMLGRKNYIRLDENSMGTGYSIPSLLAVLAGEKQHTPLSKNIHHADLAEGQSAGGYSGQAPGGQRGRCSKKFKAEHESEVLLHPAAKKFSMNPG